MEENNIISNEEEIANIMNNYFINATKTFNLKKQLSFRRSGVNEFENHINNVKWCYLRHFNPSSKFDPVFILIFSIF